MNPNALAAGTISAVAGILLSLAFSYIPKLKDWFEAQPGTSKRLVLLASLAAVTAGSVALSCVTIHGAPLLPGASQCTQTNIVEVVAAFIAALVASQSAYTLAPKAEVGAGK